MSYFFFVLFFSFFFFFFFSSRRRHTRLVSDWSSDVCSSDLGFTSLTFCGALMLPPTRTGARSEERRVGKSVDLGGRRIIKKKKKKKKQKKKKSSRKDKSNSNN